MNVLAFCALALIASSPGLSPDRRDGHAPKHQVVLAQFPQRRGPTPEEKEAWRVRVGISKEQQGRLDQLFIETDRKMTENRNKFRQAWSELNDIMGKYDYDKAAAKQKRRDIMKLHWEMQQIHAQNEDKLREVLTREQFDKMRAVIKEDMEKRRKDFENRRRPGT
jgi:Spy/CpxP family protein refolding chaperone